MTLNRLHRILGGLIAQGHGRAAVAVDRIQMIEMGNRRDL